jgi:uncharacterized oligopeptide transporter (OPT) family protein
VECGAHRVLIGVIVIIIDEVLKARGSSFRTPVLAVAVGMYLPLGVDTPILIGGLLSHLPTGNAAAAATKGSPAAACCMRPE